MAYPNRTYATVTLPGAAGPSRFLDTPVNGGYTGADAPDLTKYIESFVATEATGVAVVEETA